MDLIKVHKMFDGIKSCDDCPLHKISGYEKGCIYASDYNDFCHLHFVDVIVACYIGVDNLNKLKFGRGKVVIDASDFR